MDACFDSKKTQLFLLYIIKWSDQKGGSWALQVGHSILTSSHWVKQSKWNLCPQGVFNIIVSFSNYSVMLLHSDNALGYFVKMFWRHIVHSIYRLISFCIIFKRYSWWLGKKRLGTKNLEPNLNWRNKSKIYFKNEVLRWDR